MPNPRNTGIHGWKLEDAKARFSELVQRARSDGPQRVSVRGKDAVVVISVEDLAKLSPAGENTGASLVSLLQGSSLSELDLEREQDRGRDIRF